MSFMSNVAFLPLFMQLGQGVKATTSGLSTLPLMAGLFGSSILSGQLVSKDRPSTRRCMAGGVVVTFVGIWLLSRNARRHPRLDLAWRMAVCGVGLGPGRACSRSPSRTRCRSSGWAWSPSSSQFLPPDRFDHGRGDLRDVPDRQPELRPRQDHAGLRRDQAQSDGAAAQAHGAAPVLPPFVKVIITTPSPGSSRSASKSWPPPCGGVPDPQHPAARPHPADGRPGLARDDGETVIPRRGAL